MIIKTDLNLKRLAISVEYDGSDYCGWQEQKHEPKVLQTVVQNALSKVANKPTRIICSGRTDSGVHASSQVCHFDTDAIRNPYNWLMGANTLMPNDIALSWVQEVDDKFHARFKALSRQYTYLIHCLPYRSALMRNAAMFSQKHLDPLRMARGGAYLIGEHDFNAYRSAQCQAKTSIRKITRLSIQRPRRRRKLANGY